MHLGIVISFFLSFARSSFQSVRVFVHVFAERHTRMLERKLIHV